MTTWHLHGVGHDHRITVPEAGSVVVGRGPESGALIPDVTVSRRHAELVGTGGGVQVRDLGSANGTAINGARTVEGTVLPGDVVMFGKVPFVLMDGDAPARELERPQGVVRAVDLAGGHVLAEAPKLRENREARRLAGVLDLARRLSGQLDLEQLVTAVVDLTFELLPVDRAALLLVDAGSGALIPVRSRSRVSDAATMRVPRAIAERALTDRTAIVTENALADERFQSGSVVLQAVRGAICTPLIAALDRPLGVLYVDTLTSTRPFSDEDATLLYAFGGLAAVSIGQVRYAEEVRRENEVRANFERFFAPGVARRIAVEHGAIGVGGERRTVTALFSDIRGFTAIAQREQPDVLASHLSEFFREMVEIVFQHGGTLDKFIGDALLAVWGAPLTAPGDADRAVAAARAMQARLVELNPHWLAAGRPELAIGIGVSTGEVFAGFLGSERRLEYTVIGDAVNVASRLSDEAGGGAILIDAATAGRLTDPPALAPTSGVTIRGRSGVIAVYRVDR